MLNATELRKLISEIKEEINGDWLGAMRVTLREGVLMQSKRRDHDFSALKPCNIFKELFTCFRFQKCSRS